MRIAALALPVLLAVTPASASADPAPDPHVAFTATFKYAGNAQEEAGRRAAIDKAIASLFFAIRPIARSRLSDGTRIDPSVAFSFTGGQIRVKLPPAPDAVSPEAGGTVNYTDDSGEKSRLSQVFASSKLTQVYATDDGSRRNEWSLSADGSTLSLHVVVSSPKLSAPVIYTLTYKKAP
jgi:hypothetical protein